jgi:hypothetical protein
MLRLGASLAAVAPGPAAWFARVGGSDRIAVELASRQIDKRPADQ